jgi:hypothetical protein
LVIIILQFSLSGLRAMFTWGSKRRTA